jgi:hypothetical protein
MASGNFPKFFSAVAFRKYAFEFELSRTRAASQSEMASLYSRIINEAAARLVNRAALSGSCSIAFV